ncbi:hypothetical protein THOM_0027 [Trachipleistophora hominis]|uniref:Uncharacterized protein n=1 Tax=Trachipleistophora hominis TaxID=72359 RepID=L7K051_TRAHO|nr:hypothetical protein THOM_0027 [Trachipleistophora hominis]
MEKKNNDMELSLEKALEKRSKSSLYFSLRTADVNLCKTRVEELDSIIDKLTSKIEILEKKIEKMNLKLLPQ